MTAEHGTIVRGLAAPRHRPDLPLRGGARGVPVLHARQAVRRLIAPRWAPDGATCYRQLDSRGDQAIAARVVGTREKWVRDEGFVFRPHKSLVSHHNVARF